MERIQQKPRRKEMKVYMNFGLLFMIACGEAGPAGEKGEPGDVGPRRRKWC